jgi:hypothetical protein
VCGALREIHMVATPILVVWRQYGMPMVAPVWVLDACMVGSACTKIEVHIHGWGGGGGAGLVDVTICNNGP